MKAEDFDEKFDRGEDITSALDTAKAQRSAEHQLHPALRRTVGRVGDIT